MTGFNQALLHRLRQALLQCDEFHNPRLLYAVMGTAPLTPWQAGLPGADAVGERVDLTIHYLAEKRHVNGESALTLLLQVLAGRYADPDARGKELSELATELQEAGKYTDHNPAQEKPNMDQKTRNALLDALEKRTNLAEIKKLTFKVLGTGAYHNLRGSTHTEKCIALLEAVENRQQIATLLRELVTMRPDIDLSDSKDTLPAPEIDRDIPPHNAGITPDTKPEIPNKPNNTTPIPTQASSTLTWLHLSDLHFRASRQYDENIVLEALLQDIAERIEEDRLSPDLIAITGDVAFSGKSEEYQLARSFLDELLEITGLPRKRLYIVPGNHDVDRSLVTDGARSITSGLVNRDTTNKLLVSDADRPFIMRRFNGYAEFVNDYFDNDHPFNDKAYFYVRSLMWDGTQVAIMGLNSAWVCASDDDKAPGVLLGERQVRAALKLAEQGDLKIALLHHPFDWLREFDQTDSMARLLGKCNFILHGHLHRQRAMQLSDPDTNAMVISGGACYETRQHPNMYNFVRLDSQSRTGTVYLRRYFDESGGLWAKGVGIYKNAPDGEYTFKFEHDRRR